MTTRTIWISGCVNRQVPKPGHPYANVRIPIELREIDRGETVPALKVRVERSHRGNPEIVLDVISFEGRYWRPISKDHWSDAPSSFDDLVSGNNHDSPFRAAVNSRHRQSYDRDSPHADTKHADPVQTDELACHLREAAGNCIVIDGLPYRSCAEPTWIVARSRVTMAPGIIVQPFLGEPGISSDCAWFGWNEREEAALYAADLSERTGLEVASRGDIEPTGPFMPGFDSVFHAYDGLIDLVTRASRPLLHMLGPDGYEAHRELEIAGGSRDMAVYQAFDLAASILERQGPEVEAFRSAVEPQMDHVRYLQSQMNLTDAEQLALDGLRFPQA